MGVTYKPEDTKRRKIKDKAMKDLDPSLREPTKIIRESNSSEDPERKLTKRSKKTRDLVEKK